MGLAADDDGVCGIAWVGRFEKGKEQRHPYVENEWGKMDDGEGVMPLVTEVRGLGYRRH